MPTLNNSDKSTSLAVETRSKRDVFSPTSKQQRNHKCCLEEIFGWILNQCCPLGNQTDSFLLAGSHGTMRVVLGIFVREWARSHLSGTAEGRPGLWSAHWVRLLISENASQK